MMAKFPLRPFRDNSDPSTSIFSFEILKVENQLAVSLSDTVSVSYLLCICVRCVL